MSLWKKRSRGTSPVQIDKEKDIKPIPAIFKQLTKEMLSENPEQFRLPENVRTFFTGGKSYWIRVIS